MINFNEVKKKIQEEIRNGMTYDSLSKKYEIPKTTLNDFANGTKKVENMTLKNFSKLFPDIQIGNVSAGANNKNNKINSDNNFFKEESLMPKSNTIIQKKINTILKSPNFTAEEKLKFIELLNNKD